MSNGGSGRVALIGAHSVLNLLRYSDVKSHIVLLVYGQLVLANDVVPNGSGPRNAEMYLTFNDVIRIVFLLIKSHHIFVVDYKNCIIFRTYCDIEKTQKKQKTKGREKYGILNDN